MTGPMTMADGMVIAPTNKSFKVDFCTVANWNEKGEIVEENLFYDLMGMKAASPTYPENVFSLAV